jgi:hypothetical protein
MNYKIAIATISIAVNWFFIGITILRILSVENASLRYYSSIEEPNIDSEKQIVYFREYI